MAKETNQAPLAKKGEGKKYMKVFGRMVVIRSDQNQEETVRESGLILPDNVVPQDKRGVIIAIGHEVDMNMIKPGDRVIYNKHAGADLIWGGRNYLLMRDQDVMIVETNWDDPVFDRYEEGQKWMIELSERKA